MRARSWWGVGLAVLGVLCLAAAAILAWAVVPSQKKLPADTNTTRQYSGTAKLLLNPQALGGGDLSKAVVRNTPATASRTVKVLATSGNAAEVNDQRTLLVGGQQAGQTSVTYAVDRKSLEPASNPPSDWQVTKQQGLTVSWPIGSKKQDYTGWVNETQTTTPIKYQREETKDGVNTYVYTASAAAAPIKDPQVLAALPKSLPTTTLVSLAPALSLPADIQAALAQALPRLGNAVNLTYTYEATSTYWVEPTTGAVVDTDRAEIRKAGIGGPGGNVLVSVPIYDVSTKYTAQSVTDAVNDAKDKKSTIDTLGVVVPWILVGVGVVLVIVGVVLAVTGRRRPAVSGPPPARP